MAEILRPNFDKLWASAGSVIEPSELKIEMGWMEEVPPSQWENWIQLRQDQAIKYIFQRGIPAWDAKEEYFAGRSAVLLDGDIYIALRNNVNKSPKTNTADWRVVTKDLTIANITGLQAALNNKADKTVSITGVGGLTGGGTLAANRTIDLSAATKNSLTLADGALQKTQNLNDLPNKATARNNLGLGTAATRNVGEAYGNLMEVGAFGLGKTAAQSIPTYDEMIGTGFYFAGYSDESPIGNGIGQFLFNINDGDRRSFQLAARTSGEKLVFRSTNTGVDGFYPWREIHHSGNLHQSTGSSTEYPMSQKAVTDALSTKTNTTTQIIAGNGLTGGGSLAASRTLTLGTPSTITKTATNSVSPTSHTHELGADVKASLALADGALQKNANLNDVADKAKARDNLGLGTAATKDTDDFISTADFDTFRSQMFPVGMCYTQYPDTPTPSELFGGTWTLMFNTEGVFFRTEGQGASAFGSGVQGDAMQRILGELTGSNGSMAAGGSGAFTVSNRIDYRNTLNAHEGGSYGKAIFDSSQSPGVRTAEENRPRNITVRVWRKTAH